MPEKLYDLSILSEYVYGDKEFMKELIHTFLETAPIDTRILLDSCSTSDFKQAGAMAHKLKSSMKTIGITSLVDLIYEIEMDAKSEASQGDICAKINTFSNKLTEVLAALKAEIS